MASASSEASRWTKRHWVGMVVLIFLVQLILIFWLGERGPARVRPGSGPSVLELAAKPASEFLELEDPTLFALPHAQSFTGEAWLKVRRIPLKPFEWSEPEKWLELPIEPLGAAFRGFMATNRIASLEMPVMPEPELVMPEARPLRIPVLHSDVRVRGALSQRRLLTQVVLPSWPPRTNALNELDLLTNTVVQLAVNAAGRVVSTTLSDKSGADEADRLALVEARLARFEPVGGGENEAVTNPLGHLMWGEMVFRWATTAEPGIQNPKGEARKNPEGRESKDE